MQLMIKALRMRAYDEMLTLGQSKDAIAGTSLDSPANIGYNMVITVETMRRSRIICKVQCTYTSI